MRIQKLCASNQSWVSPLRESLKSIGIQQNSTKIAIASLWCFLGGMLFVEHAPLLNKIVVVVFGLQRAQPGSFVSPMPVLVFSVRLELPHMSKSVKEGHVRVYWVCGF